MTVPMLLPGQVLWPSWSGNSVEANVPCPECEAKTTTNIAGTSNPEGYCAYICKECGTHFEVGGSPPTSTITQRGYGVFVL